MPHRKNTLDEIRKLKQVFSGEEPRLGIRPEHWILAPIAVTLQNMHFSQAPALHLEKKESKTAFFLQTLVPFIFAGIGLIMAGLMLESAENYRFIVELPDAVMIIPTLLGLKGNLEMTLSSRLSTLANLHLMDTQKAKVNVAFTNMALVQTQAIVVSSVAVLPVLLLGQNPMTWGDVLCLTLSTVATASISSLILSLLMVIVVIVARYYKLNPDNISTPLAASLGDFSTLLILLATGSLLIDTRHYHPTYLLVILFLYYVFAVIAAVIATRDQFTLEVLKHGWWPVFTAMGITTGSGFLLQRALKHFPPLAAFQPLLNGLGGNLVAVQASRISTQLHINRKNKEKEVEPLNTYFSPIRAFFYKTEEAVSARILLAILIPCDFVFVHFIFLFGCGFQNTIVFTLSFILVCLIQVVLLLYVCQILVRAMWVLRVDPDNSAIPILTALGDLVGTLLLIGCFTFNALVFQLPVSSEFFTGHRRIH
ncbi:unnamed protein product [Caenorhabditis auriculariae]|uniref:SLC41A/MgtE integral membrane domain-containing protein n=1 Tax=Caenorhabditis auriculariae TaxID=2777116 RepID=A0A8S1HJT4_9PELO|nr:unnamed protein product [Caenorhabditis auriculariae]